MEIYYITMCFTKNDISGTKAATKRCFQKTANPELYKRKDR